ncbi:MAG TPA: protoheme IX farnesyltransferase [Anaerolineales bacterium]
MASVATAVSRLRVHYWPLVKSRQTFMLTITGMAGYLCQPTMPLEILRFLCLVGSLLLTISGCTVLNMLFDRDIDRKMTRTRSRPMAVGQVQPRAALSLGIALISLGLIWSVALSRLYFLIILAGVGLNVLVYTIWLKRRTAWSILLGGIAGGMPILAGRVLATGQIDMLGLLLALVIIHWIPSHNLTLTTIYATDYRQAGVPTILNVYGASVTRLMVTVSSIMVALFSMIVSAQLGLSVFFLVILPLASMGLVSLAAFQWIKPSKKLMSILFKYSSLYMLVLMLSITISGVT